MHSCTGCACYKLPKIQFSAVADLFNTDSTLHLSAYEKIVAAYWKPAYKHVRLRWKAAVEPDSLQPFRISATRQVTGPTSERRQREGRGPLVIQELRAAEETFFRVGKDRPTATRRSGSANGS